MLVISVQSMVEIIGFAIQSQALQTAIFNRIFAIDADTAYITVYKLLGSAGNARGIYKTTDGGTNWTRQNVYNNSQSGPGYIHFFDSQNGLVIADPNLETYTTTNGGLTWTPVTMPTPLSEEYTWLGESRITASRQYCLVQYKSSSLQKYR